MFSYHKESKTDGNLYSANTWKLSKTLLNNQWIKEEITREIRNGLN